MPEGVSATLAQAVRPQAPSLPSPASGGGFHIVAALAFTAYGPAQEKSRKDPTDERRHEIQRARQLRREGVAIRRHRRSDQALRISLYRAQSGRELSRPARLAGQLRRQPAADPAVPAREDRRADRPWLRQGDRQADGGDRARRGRHAARHHGHLLRLYRPLPGLRYRRHRADGRKPAPAVHRLDSHRECQRRATAPLREMGLSAVQHRGRAGFVFAGVRGDDDRAAGPDLHVLRRLAAGAAAVQRRGAAEGIRQQSAGADGGRREGARSGRRPFAGGEISGADGRICGAQRGRLRQSRCACRNCRRRGVRRSCAAEFPQPASAQSELRKGDFPRRRSHPVARHAGLGEVDPFQ